MSAFASAVADADVVLIASVLCCRSPQK